MRPGGMLLISISKQRTTAFLDSKHPRSRSRHMSRSSSTFPSPTASVGALACCTASFSTLATSAVLASARATWPSHVRSTHPAAITCACFLQVPGTVMRGVDLFSRPVQATHGTPCVYPLGPPVRVFSASISCATAKCLTHLLAGLHPRCVQMCVGLVLVRVLVMVLWCRFRCTRGGRRCSMPERAQSIPRRAALAFGRPNQGSCRGPTWSRCKPMQGSR